MAVENVTSVVVAIDTTDYSGNFEREMCAFITGQVGECGVGEEYIEEAEEELGDMFAWFDEHIVSESDEREVYRPASIWPTPGWFNNGMGGHYKEGEDNEEQAALDRYNSVVEYTKGRLEIATRRLAENDFESKESGWTKETCIQVKTSIETELEELKTAKLTKYPAYFSVAIFFDEVPPKEIMGAIVERAKRFAVERPDWPSYQGEKKQLQITSIRVLEPKLVKPRVVEHVEVTRIQF